MSATAIWSALLGVGLAALNGAVSLVTLKRAAKLSDVEFFKRVMSSIGLRMAAVLGVMLLVLSLVPVDRLWFVGAFVIGLVIGLIVEVVVLRRRLP